jgi:hypothetical membrane protein
VKAAPDRLVVGGLLGPALFVADWALLGATRPAYSPVDDAISRLAERGAPRRHLMTAGFVAYGIGLISYGVALRRAAAPGPAWVSSVGTGVATLGVAAFPLGPPRSDRAHAVFAVLSYMGLAALPTTMAPAQAAGGHPRRARLSVLTGATTAAALLTSATVRPAHGLTQRIGVTVGDIWVMLSAAARLRRR